MTHAPGRFHRYVLAALALACAGLAGCHEDTVAPKNHPTPNGPMANLGTYIVHVDVKHGVVTVHPLGSDLAAPKGVSARFYGLSTQIEHELTVVPPTPIGQTGAEYHLQDRINNLLTFAIGTNSPHTAPAFPQDTMGVYVYYSVLPYNIQGGPCPCSVTIDSVDGSYPFTSGTPQPYVFFKTILEGGGPGAGHFGRNFSNQTDIGGIDYFKTLNFNTIGSITEFSFGLSVSAAWVDPNESRWKVFYVADSLPDRVSLQDLRSEPDWRVLGTGGGTATIAPPGCTPVTSSCKLQIVSNTPGSLAKDTLMYYRSDSLRASKHGYITATMTASGLTAGASPGVFLGLKDPAKLVQLGISGTLTGFTDSSGAFVGTPVATNLARVTWRVAKFGTDSAAIYSPADSAKSIVSMTYASLPTAPPRVVYDRFFFFGNITQTALSTATSVWTNVNYEIGAYIP